MKKYLVLFLVLMMALPVLAQKKKLTHNEALQRKNSFVLTLGGNGIFLSLSYDRVLAVKPGFFVDANVGLGLIPMIGGTSFSQQLVFNLGKRTGFLMLGMGGTYEWHKTDASGFTQTKTSYHLSPIVGWKKIFRSHLIFSVYASPLIHISGAYMFEDWPVAPYGGIGLAYSF
jgi:hypothetical protein